MVGLKEEQRGNEMRGIRSSVPDILVFDLKVQNGMKADDWTVFASLDR